MFIVFILQAVVHHQADRQPTVRDWALAHPISPEFRKKRLPQLS
jgi:hypothetical protein